MVSVSYVCVQQCVSKVKTPMASHPHTSAKKGNINVDLS